VPQDGETPLSVARDHGHTAIMKLLRVSWFAVVGDQRGCRVSSLACAFRGELRRSGVTQVAAGQKPVEEAAPALGTLTVKQLQAECKRLGLKGYTGLNKEKLVALLHPTTTTIGEKEAEEAAAPIDGKDAKGGKRKGKEAAGAAPKAKKNKKADAAAEASDEEVEEESEVSLLELSGACDVRDQRLTVSCIQVIVP
jgi:ribosomal protein L12E/L44/L45/RPP1/RPP2